MVLQPSVAVALLVFEKHSGITEAVLQAGWVLILAWINTGSQGLRNEYSTESVLCLFL